MMGRVRVWMCVGLLLGIAGCASPRYQTVYRYEGPTEPAGQSCVKGCEPKLASCQSSCQAGYQACIAKITPAVDADYRQKLKDYDHAVDRYNRALAFYQFQVRMGYGDPWHNHSFYSLWPEPYYYPPAAPMRPSRDRIFSQVAQEKCNQDCGCQPTYDACFLSCGGKKIPEVHCLANCAR